MKTRELIEALKAMPPDADVLCLWDGAPRTEAEVVYLSRAGQVILADYAEVCYEVEDRPEGAPGGTYWYTPQEPSQ